MDNISKDKEKACLIASKLLESDEDYLDNIIELWQVGLAIYKNDAWGTEFHILGVISSETDHLPTKLVRQYCSISMLDKSDEEITRINRVL